MLEFLRQYPDTQLDAEGKIRNVWLFEFRVHDASFEIPIANDAIVSDDILTKSRLANVSNSDDDEIITETVGQQSYFDIERIEHTRIKLLAMEARDFEFFIKGLLLHCGFSDVCVTQFCGDGGIDVNARAGREHWVFEDTLVQIQAKRWLHSVGRKEVAELRGSLQAFARGALVTTSHFSKAAIREASEEGKNPIRLIDGIKLSRIVLDEQYPLKQ